MGLERRDRWERKWEPFAYLSFSPGKIILSLRQPFQDCRNLMLRLTERMLFLRFYKGKSLPCWEVVHLSKRPRRACLGLWCLSYHFSLCTSSRWRFPFALISFPLQTQGKGYSPIFILEHFTALLTNPIQANMSGWGQLIHNFPLFSGFLHHGVYMISVHLIKGYIDKLLSSRVWVCREHFWNTLQGNSFCPLLPLQATWNWIANNTF